MVYHTVNEYTKRRIHDGYTLYQKDGCPEIGVAKAAVIERDGLLFRDLVKRLTPEEMMGLMLHSSSQPVPAMPGTMMRVEKNPGVVVIIVRRVSFSAQIRYNGYIIFRKDQRKRRGDYVKDQERTKN